MPSSHAQFAGFFAIYFVLLLQLRLAFKPNLLRHLISLGVIVSSTLVCYSRFANLLTWCDGGGIHHTNQSLVFADRVYLQYHTEMQVVVGVLVSAPVALFWFFLIEPLVKDRLFPLVSDTWLMRWLMVRDSSDVEDIFQFEYQNIQQRRKQQNKNKAK